jgi:DNA polymerase III subunit delta'
MLFSQIIGQQDIKSRFIRTVTDARIPHAQLLRGPEGVGKLALAIAYAQYICCENKQPADSCGVCPSCLKYNKLIHPDLHFVFPIVKPTGKSSVVCDEFLPKFREMILHTPYFGLNDWYAYNSAESKQGMIYSNESEEILRKLNLKTFEAEYKIMIIWYPEKMNITCANKVLKILEEPPEKTLFLLVSNEPELILTTILSRTQQIQVARLSDEEITMGLKAQKGGDINKYAHVVKVANGSYLKALQALMDSGENNLNFEQFVKVMRLAWQVGNKQDHASLKTLKSWSEEMSSSSVGRERQKSFLAYAQHMTRENFVLNLHQQELNYFTSEESDFSQRFCPFINERNVEDLMNEFAIAERHIEQNVNAKMVFFDLVLKIIMLLKR